MDLGETYKILQNIIHDMATAPDGISTGEIVGKYGISRRVVPKYISILEDAGVPIYTDRKRYYLSEGYFAAFTLSPEESEFLYLVLERSLIYHRDRWHTMRSLLYKLGSKMSIPLGDTLLLKHDHDQPNEPGDRWFSLLTYAKQKRYEVWVTYHPLHRPNPNHWLIRPFRFVSNPLSDGLYVLCEGTTDGHGYIPLSLKFDRILDVQMTNNRFDVVEAARFGTYDGHAWGVWNSERDPVQVQLQFEPRHYDRLLETAWHPTQKIAVDSNGYVRFSVAVSEPQEMVPWIRSWGSGVVVLEPDDLRQRIIWSLQRQLQAYGLVERVADTAPSLVYLWAKYDRKTGAYHALLYHLLDVAAVTWVMWQQVLSSAQRTWLCGLIGMEDEGTRRWLALLAGLHDIGKATPGFQRKAEPLFDRLVASGLSSEGFDEPHGLLSAIILQRQLAELGIEKGAAHQLAAVLGGHHGTWISDHRMNQKRAAIGKPEWQKLQAQVFEAMVQVLAVNAISLPDNVAQLNQLLVFLSGFVSVCDWIGSNDTYFAYEMQAIEPGTYFEHALTQAETALAEMGWGGWKLSGDTPIFETVFPFPPNALQREAIQVCDFSAGKPRLVLVEYLTGGGKTELALYLADCLVNLFGQAGVYVAMPTQATSNQMFERVGQYLEARYPHQPINIQLIHAQADQHPLYQQLSARTEREGDESGLIATTWFQNRKRSLLAPFAVGTVDQALLGVLQTRHHFVRQYGLSHKTVIFDEIHAYDTYMNAIVDRLLGWLEALQSPVILLSATLPRNSRQRLLEQVGIAEAPIADVPYPRLTIVDKDGNVQVYPLPAPATRILHIYRIGPNTAPLCDWLATVYQDGGCIAIICNTVDEAIALAHALRTHPELNADDVLLFHARFPSQWRNTIENQVLTSFGKTGQRPERMILVATQIIEQSLDLDFDLMVSSVAPIDLLIQRAGRLHRHAERSRPAHLSEPVLVLREPQFGQDDVPGFGVDEIIYVRFILLKTWLLLRDRAELAIPDEIDPMMDFVYSDDPVVEGLSQAYTKSLQAAWEEMVMGDNGARFRGEAYRIGAPDDEFLIGGTSLDLSDDEQIRITTRDIRSGIDILCVRTDHSDLPLPVLPDRPPTNAEISTLLRFRVTIRNQEVMQALKNMPENPHLSRSPQLKDTRPIVFSSGSYAIPGSRYLLRLSRFYGLEIIKEDV